jgi:hypothetical protein
MPIATRAMSLQEAVKYHTVGEKDGDVLKTAELFHNFIMKDEVAPTAVVSTPDPEPAPKSVKPKPAKGEVKPAKSEDQLVTEAQDKARAAAEAADTPTVTKEQVSEALVALIKGGKRAQAESLLQIHGASSLSTLEPNEWPKFVAAAQSLLKPTAGADSLLG